MSLKPVTLQLDMDEYEKLKEYINELGDPDISIEVAIRSYIRNLNRAMPLALKPNWDLNNYFELMNTWLKNFDYMIENGMFTKSMGNPFNFWQWTQSHFWTGTNNQKDCGKSSTCEYEN